MPLGVTTLSLPVVAPAGTVVVIKELETTLKAAACLPLKRNLGRAGQIGPKDLDALSHFARRSLCLHERAQTHREPENGPTASGWVNRTGQVPP